VSVTHARARLRGVGMNEAMGNSQAKLEAKLRALDHYLVQGADIINFVGNFSKNSP